MALHRQRWIGIRTKCVDRLMPWRGYNWGLDHGFPTDSAWRYHLSILMCLIPSPGTPNLGKKKSPGHSKCQWGGIKQSWWQWDYSCGYLCPLQRYSCRQSHSQRRNPTESGGKITPSYLWWKAGDVRYSMRVPQGMEGVVTDVVVFNREGVERDERTKEIE